MKVENISHHNYNFLYKSSSMKSYRSSLVIFSILDFKLDLINSKCKRCARNLKVCTKLEVATQMSLQID